MLALPNGAFAQTVTRGPYLQMGTPDSMIVRWRTNLASESVVRYGPSPSQLVFQADTPGTTTEHVVEVPLLDPATTYFYSVGTQSQTLAGGDADHMFITSPVTGMEQPTRIWVVGDPGTANNNQRAVRDRYLELTGPDYTHLFLMLGDNAYNDGTDSEHQAAMFDIYPTILRQTPVWPTLGNHDGRSAVSNNESGVYYDIFTLPRNGEAGGLASGTEAYYSFDYANIHFIVLESFETDRSVNGAMMTWLRDDVLFHDQLWVIAFWHHPPYSKGSHDSDSESFLIDMRQNALPILEGAGVDLVLGGHSHAYERSPLIDGHYGNSGSFNTNNLVDGGNGQVTGDGAYEKPGDFIGDPNQGAVYVVAGSSGSVSSSGALNHAAMLVNIRQLGSVILEVDGDVLDATFLNNNGGQPDSFRIVKALSLPEVSVVASDGTATEAGETGGTLTVSRTGDLTAPLTVNYTVSGTATSGADFVALGGSVTIAAGEADGTIAVTAIDDSFVERDETVIVTLSADAAYQVGSPGNATVTIESDESPPLVNIVASDPTATEAGLTGGSFTVSRAGTIAGALTVHYSVSGSATAGADYAALGGSVILGAGSSMAVIAVTPIDDGLIEADETVVVTLSTDADYDIGIPDSATVTIESDEAIPTVAIVASDATATEAGPTGGAFTVTRSQNTTAALTVFYTVGGTATPGSDYAALSGSVALAANQNNALIAVDPVDDGAFEPDETVVVTLSADAAYGIGTPASDSVTIVNDDAEPAETLTLIVANAFDNKNGKSYFPGGPDGSAPVNDLNTLAEEGEVEILGDDPDFFWDITYQTPDPTLGDPEEVMVALNYRPESSWNGDFTAEYRVGGSVLASIALPGNSNGQAESFLWDLSAVVTTAGDLSGGVVRLINDDPNGKKIFAHFSSNSVRFGGGNPPPLPTVSLAVTDGTATEAGLTSGAVTVSRAGGSTATALTVPYSVAGTAIADSDYVALSGLATIAAGETSVVISVDPIDDATVEAVETVEVSLTPEPAFELGTPASGSVTITSDDGAGLPTVSLVASDSTATEAGPTSGAFTVSRAGDTSAALSVSYTVSGTATSGADYGTLSGSVIIAAGATSATIGVDPVDDADVEADETVVTTLAASAAYQVGTPSSGVVTITSDDVALPVVSLVASDGTATEAGPTSGAFTVSRAGDTSTALTVSYTIGGTATSGADYAALNGSVTIAAGTTDAVISVDPVDDADVEVDETVVATLAADAAYQVGTPASGTVTITSEDQPSSTAVILSVVNLLDNKNGKNYFAGGPDGTDPLDDINSLAEEGNIEVLGDDPSFFWEADYGDPDPLLGDPTAVTVTLNYRPEQDWTGSFTVEYRVGGSVLASATLPGNSAGNAESIVWDLSSVVTTANDLANGRLRFVNNDPDNGKKVFVSFSVVNATLGGGGS